MEQALATARQAGEAAVISAAEKALRANTVQRFNNLLDAVVAGTFLCLVVLIVVLSVFEWLMLVARKRAARLTETKAVWLPDYAMTEANPLRAATLIALGFALLRELSGEAKADRIRQECTSVEGSRVTLNVSAAQASSGLTREQAYVRATEERFNGINRCC